MKNLTLLAVDDDELILESLKLGLPQHWRLIGVNSAHKVPLEGDISAAFVDMHLSGNVNQAEGLEVVKKLKSNWPHLEIVAMSGNLDRSLMEKCLRAGASRYIAKPLNPDEVNLILDKIEALLLLQHAAFRSHPSTYTWLGSSEESKSVLKQIALMKGENGPILIEGETGTGKEVVAQLIHQQEDDRPMVTINVAAIPSKLFESEMFGHTRGAFTGADQNKMGLAEAADGGDLFLDEIEALSLAHQAKLLRFLESGEIRRVGGKDSIKVKTRVIAATNKNLEQLVREGQFREDLLFRLSSKKIYLPPLRERKSDVKELAEFFLSVEKARKKNLDDDAVESLMGYHWPGNVRELKRVCEQLALHSPLPVIRKEEVEKIILPRIQSPLTEDIDFTQGLDVIVQNFESSIISKVLQKYNDVEEVARVLNISRSSLYKKIKDYNISWRAE